MVDLDDHKVKRAQNAPGSRSGATETLVVFVLSASTLLIAGNGLTRPLLAAATLIGVTMGVTATIAFLNYRRISINTHASEGNLVSSQASLALGLLLTSTTLGWLAVMVKPATVIIAAAAISYRVSHETAFRNHPRLRALSSAITAVTPTLVCWFAITARAS